MFVLEYESAPFMRATYVNQARIHMDYHYPRSYATAIKSAGYFKRFSEEFEPCVHTKFDQVYAISSAFSWTSAKQFSKFCKNINVLCEPLNPAKLFKDGMCDGAFLTEEYTFDANLLRGSLLLMDSPTISLLLTFISAAH